MTTQSSAGLRSSRLRSSLALSAVALAALAGSLLLAFASAIAPQHRPNGGAAVPAAVAGAKHPVGTATMPPLPRPPPATFVEPPPPLWTLLAPWAFAVDAIAVLGLAAVLRVRR